MPDGEGRTLPSVLAEVKDEVFLVEHVEGRVRGEVLRHEDTEPHAGRFIGEKGRGGSEPHHVVDRHCERLFERDVDADEAEVEPSFPPEGEGRPYGGVQFEASHLRSQAFGVLCVGHANGRKRHERHRVAPTGEEPERQDEGESLAPTARSIVLVETPAHRVCLFAKKESLPGAICPHGT